MPFPKAFGEMTANWLEIEHSLPVPSVVPSRVRL